jgi:hypothetical protein
MKEIRHDAVIEKMYLVYRRPLRKSIRRLDSFCSVECFHQSSPRLQFKRFVKEFNYSSKFFFLQTESAFEIFPKRYEFFHNLIYLPKLRVQTISKRIGIPIRVFTLILLRIWIGILLYEILKLSHLTGTYTDVSVGVVFSYFLKLSKITLL